MFINKTHFNKTLSITQRYILLYQLTHCRSMYLCLSFHLSVCLSIHLSINPHCVACTAKFVEGGGASEAPSPRAVRVKLPIFLSVSVVYQSIHLPTFLPKSIHPSIYRSIYLSIFNHACLHVSQILWEG